MSENNNTPAMVTQYATSAMVNVPLHELDVLRADLMKATTELSKLRDTQAQVKVTFAQKLVKEKQVYDAGWGYKTYKENLEPIEEIRYIKMEDVLAEVAKDYSIKLLNETSELRDEANQKVAQVKEDYQIELEEIKRSYSAMRVGLQEKYNGDRIELLESELEKTSADLVTCKKDLKVECERSVILGDKVAKLFRYYEKLEKIQQVVDDTMQYNVFDRFLKGRYKKIDAILDKDVTDE